MLRIAICDDDSATVQANRKIAADYLKQCGSAGEIATYTHSDNLIYDITEDGFFFDLILLDIEMPGSTGMELAAEEFIFIDRGCIVNMIHVMQVKDGSVILKNGAALPISRSHLQEAKAQINAYWGAHI